MIKIAVDGPDGSGKSSICNSLLNQLSPAMVVYAGKNHSHNYKITTYALNLWKKASKVSTLLALFVQYFIFYPIEFFENLKRFNSDYEENIIFDRHPLDRLIMKHELLLKYKNNQASIIRLLIEYPPRFFWGQIYKWFFPTNVKVFLLLPTAELIFERSGGQYKSMNDAEVKVKAYKLAMKEWNDKVKFIRSIHIDKNTSIDYISTYIIEQIKEEY